MTNRGGGDRTLKITILGDTKDAERAVKELELSLGGVERGGSKASMGVGVFAAGAAAAGVAAAAAAVAIGHDLFNAFAASEQASVKLGAVLKASGNVWNTTKEDILSYSTELQHATGIADETITNVQTLFLTFREVGPEAFKRATEAALDMSAVFGQDASGSAVMLGKALQDPIAGVTALRRVGVQLSDEQEEQIKKFAEVNDIVGAQNIILGELEKQVGGTARALGETATGKVDRLVLAFDDLKEAAGEGVAEGLTPLLEALTKFAESDEAIEHAKTLAGVFVDIAEKVGTATGAVINFIGWVNQIGGAGKNGKSGFWSEAAQSLSGINALEAIDKLMTDLMGARWKGTDWEREQKRIAAGNPEVIDAAPNVTGWTPEIPKAARATSFGSGGGGSAKEDPIVTAWKSINAQLQSEQQKALMEGGQRQLEEVRYSQSEIVRATQEMAERAHQAIGIDMSDALKVAFDFMRDQAKDSAQALKDYAEAEKKLADARREEANRLSAAFVTNGAGVGGAFAAAYGAAISGPVTTQAQIDAAIAAGNAATNARDTNAGKGSPAPGTVKIELSSDLKVEGGS